MIKKRKIIIMAVLFLMGIGYSGNAENINKMKKNGNFQKTTNRKKALKNKRKILNSKEYAQVLDAFMERAGKYLETGDKIRLVNDYIENIENAKVSEKALKDNYDKDREAFLLVEVAIFMKSSYPEKEGIKKLTDEDYEKIQKKFANTEKFRQLEQKAELQ